MSRPLNEKPISGATSTETGERFNVKGHSNITLMVVANNLGGADSLSVDLEHSPRGSAWDSLLTLSESDISDGTGTKTLSNVALENIRSNITNFTDDSGGDLSVDVFLIANGNPGRGHSGYSG